MNWPERQKLYESARAWRLALGAALLSAAIAAAGAPPGAGAAPARYRTGALLSAVLTGNSPSAHTAVLAGRVKSAYRPCKRRRVVRFYHRVGGRDLYLGLDWKGRPSRHRTSRSGRVVATARAGKARKGAYYMKVGEKTLPNGAICLPAKSNLRRPRVFNP